MLSATALVALGVAQLSAQVPALVDPQQSVFAAFPEADSYRVIIRDVDSKDRKRIEDGLPFRVHFDELGEHSLYVAYRGRQPIGMIYAQDEESAFGLAAVEWAFTLDLQVSSFRFQRVRSKYRRAVERSEFVRLLKGCSGPDLAAFVGEEGRLLEPAKGVADGAQELVGAVVRSGIKSLCVLEVVWGAEIGKLRDLATGLAAFPAARHFRRIWPPATAEKPRAAVPNPAHDVEPDTEIVVAIRAFSATSQSLGVVAECRVNVGVATTLVRWTIDRRGVVVSTDVPPSAPRAFRAACNDIEGMKLEALAGRSDGIGAALRRLHELTSPKAKPTR